MFDSTTTRRIPMFDAERVQRLLIEFDDLGGDTLENAMAVCAHALESRSFTSDPVEAFNLSILHATVLYLLFERDGQSRDIDEAEKIFHSLIASPDLPSSLVANVQYGLGRVYEARHDQYGLMDGDQFKACECFQIAWGVVVTSSDVELRLSNDIAVHLARHLQNLNMDPNDEAVYSEAFSLLSSVIQRTTYPPLRAFALLYLSSVYHRRWHSGTRESTEYLTKAEELVREALLISPHHRHRSRFLRHLAIVLVRWDTPDRVREGMSLAEEALSLLQPKTIPPLRRIDDGVLHHLAYGCMALFAMEGRLYDLDLAIKYIQMVAPNDRTLISLCQGLCIRFEVTGRLVDIDGAIEAGQQARTLIESNREGVPDEIYLYGGRAFLLRYIAGGEGEDLEAARVEFETGIATSRLPALLPDFQRCLATLYELRFNTSAQHTDLDTAISHGAKAVELILARTKPATDGPSFISEHGAHLLRRFQLQKNPHDLAKSIEMQEIALQLAPAGYFEQHVMLWRSAQALRLRYDSHWALPDYHGCEQLLQDALQLAIVGGLPKQSLYLSELASLYSARYRRTLLPNGLDLCLEFYAKAVSISDSHISDRFSAALTGARLAQEHGQVAQATELFSKAVSFLPRLAWLGLNASKRHAKLAQTASQLACDAAASAISSNQYERAVELLDEGRAILWRSVLELRTDLRALQDAAPELAKELLEVAQALEQDDMGSFQGAQVTVKHAEERAARRRRTAERWEELVMTVRALDGFNSFLKPQEFEKLQRAARDGPVVLLNVSEYRSDAIIVSLNEPVRIVPLPSLDVNTVRRLASLLMRALAVPRDKRGRNLLETALLDISRQIWGGGLDLVAGVLTQWQRHFPGSPLHVWWIPTGFLSLLPVHIAGSYKLDRPGIPDLFISSYSTTLSALLMARETRDQSRDLGATVPITRIAMLAIGVPETPGFPPLPSTREEMMIVDRSPSFKDSCSVLYGPQVTLAAVTNALPDHNWLHACCHGHTDMERPLDSAFRLMDGALTLSSIAQMRLEDAEFAFLSACHSARHTVFGTDEALHLAAGLQVAGFKGVVGTAWGMVDRDGPQLARRFYHHLTVNGTEPDAKGAAEALYLSIKYLRKTGVPMYRWAAFVHFGI